ncbi:MAG: 2-oxoacid:acceptor oxidoreductase subunit alpha [Myxococcales bacterium]|jgi:2-oxoglutarate ferredoxin oxidoreductase subunit alpha|nr:2-oxoacid:acceptor oxidoreductase subunit alpha [Myxococcales bacterium]
MKPDSRGLLSGRLFIDGDHACAEGAIAAGCRFTAGYPITPSTEVVERLAQRFPFVGGTFIQMEDELAASITVLGAVWGGAKAICVTSGPGFSLMMEHLGYAAMTETPVVFIDVQRGGPSTGLPTLPAQGDMMQARWGTHGDCRFIALCPSSPQECFDLTIEAFNLSERFRTPVLLMMDEVVGHMTERVVIPSADDLDIVPRRYTDKAPGEFKLFEPRDDLVPDMCRAGQGHRIHLTGLTHDERGYPVLNADTQDRLVRRLADKIERNAAQIVRVEERNLDGADIAVVAYGITARIAERAIEMARAQGIQVGSLRLITAWPFPTERLQRLASEVSAIVVPELNLGQMVLEVERVVAGRCRVISVDHAGGTVHLPKQIHAAIESAAREAGVMRLPLASER